MYKAWEKNPPVDWTAAAYMGYYKGRAEIQTPSPTANDPKKNFGGIVEQFKAQGLIGKGPIFGSI